MTKVYVTINKFHEKKRRIEYATIKRKLNIPDEDTVFFFFNIILNIRNHLKRNKNLSKVMMIVRLVS